MQTIMTIGLDIAKSVFPVHGIDAEGTVGPSPAAEASLRPCILSKAPAMPGWHRDLRIVTLLVPRTQNARPCGTKFDVRSLNSQVGRCLVCVGLP